MSAKKQVWSILKAKKPKAPRPNYVAEIEHRVCGIPCLIGVLSYDSVKGSFSYNAASDLDYHGYSDSDWEILDRKGYRAKWLDAKMDSDEIAMVEERINEYFQDQQDDDYYDYD